MSNRKEWDKLLADLRTELMSTEDEDEIEDILQNYLKKIKTEMID